MSRLAQQVQAMTNELRKKAQSGGHKQKGRKRTMDDTERDAEVGESDNNLGGDNLTADTESADVNSESNAQESAGGDIEPDAVPAGAEQMDSTKKAAAKTAKKTTTRKAAAPKAAKPKAGKATKATAKPKAAKAPKTPKAPKAEKVATNKGIVGQIPTLAKDLTVTVSGKGTNKYANLLFSNGHLFKLHLVGYEGRPVERSKARDVLVAWLKDALER